MITICTEYSFPHLKRLIVVIKCIVIVALHLKDDADVVEGFQLGFDRIQMKERDIADISEITDGVQIILRGDDGDNFLDGRAVAAVASEYFFEKPFVMKKRYPELYEMLTKIFHQDLTNKFTYQLRDLMGFTGKKVGRNAPCPCGSGEKYKHCCLK